MRRIRAMGGMRRATCAAKGGRISRAPASNSMNLIDLVAAPRASSRIPSLQRERVAIDSVWRAATPPDGGTARDATDQFVPRVR